MLTNPPFDGNEGKEAQDTVPFDTLAMQVLFVQFAIDRARREAQRKRLADARASPEAVFSSPAQ